MHVRLKWGGTDTSSTPGLFRGTNANAEKAVNLKIKSPRVAERDASLKKGRKEELSGGSENSGRTSRGYGTMFSRKGEKNVSCNPRSAGGNGGD